MCGRLSNCCRVKTCPPIVQSAETVDLKSIQCGFESHWGDTRRLGTAFTRCPEIFVYWGVDVLRRFATLEFDCEARV